MTTEGQAPVASPRISEPGNDPVSLLRERLLDREQQLRVAQEMARFGIWEWDIAANVVEWSDQLHAIYGTTPGLFSPSYDAYVERLHPEDREHVAATIGRALEDHLPFEFDERIVRDDGTVRTLNSAGQVIVDAEDRPVRMIGVCQDVTEQRVAHAAVTETADRLAEAQSIAHIGSWRWDIASDHVAWSDEMYRVYGLDPERFGASYTGFLECVHPDDRDMVDTEVQRAFAAGGDFEFDHRIVRPDGAVRVLHARGRTLADASGKATGMVGTGHDVTDQREAQAQASQASVALAFAERLADLQRITEAALAHLSLEELLPELLERICDTLDTENGAVLLMDDDGETLVLSAVRGLGADEVGFRLAVGGGFAGRVAAERKTIVLGERAYDQVKSPALRASGMEAMAGVPLLNRGRVLGVLHVGSLRERSFGPDELALLELAAERAAMAIEHARVFEHERRVAETLQRALLPGKLPELDGMSAAVRYVPATDGAEIGGDWYDVIRLDGGRVGVALGDVTGHGLEAAALMGQLRHGLRAYALENLPPATIAARLNHLIHTPDLERLATLVYAVVSPDLSVHLVNAGHLPPLIVRAAGSADFVGNASGLPIGCNTDSSYKTEHLQIDPGDVILLYTDGLIERRGESIDDGMERLRDLALEGPLDPELLADHLIRSLLPGSQGEDDIALLTLSVSPLSRELS